MTCLLVTYHAVAGLYEDEVFNCCCCQLIGNDTGGRPAECKFATGESIALLPVL